MGKYEKLIEKILIGKSDQNIDCNDLVYLLLNLGFEQRIKGSHHIFYKEDIVYNPLVTKQSLIR